MIQPFKASFSILLLSLLISPSVLASSHSKFSNTTNNNGYNYEYTYDDYSYYYDDYSYSDYDYTNDYSDYSYQEYWKINSFHADIFIKENGTVDITETIVADFTDEAHRGVLRTIPFEYETRSFTKYHAILDFKEAVNELGESWDNTVYTSNGILNIEMRNHENIPTNDVNTFILSYSAKNVVINFEESLPEADDATFPATKSNPTDNYDEFYWNINGIDWPVNVEKVSARIYLPKSFNDVVLNTTCYTGTYGSKQQDCTWVLEDENTLYFESNEPFLSYENLSVAVAFVPGVIDLPSAFFKIWWFLKANWELFIPLMVFAFMFLLWYTKGRDDPTLKNTVVPRFERPKDLLPTETGTVIDEKVDPRDVTATIIDFAIRGYIKITEIEEKKLFGKSKDHELELVKPYVVQKPFEETILSAIFPSNTAGTKVKISSLRNKFYVHFNSVKKQIMQQLVTDGYFPHNPATVRAVWITIGTVIALAPLYLGQLIILFLSPLMIGSIIVSGIIIAIFGCFLPRKTQKGAETYYELKGLYEYIDTAEKDRLKFQEENNILFEKLLPFAISFGLATKWAKAFEGIINTPPNWYYPASSWTHFSMYHFADNLTSFSNSFTSNIISAPNRSGGGWSGGSGFGGGFSGGGFGGGGGRGL